MKSCAALQKLLLFLFFEQYNIPHYLYVLMNTLETYHVCPDGTDNSATHVPIPRETALFYIFLQVLISLLLPLQTQTLAVPVRLL